MPRTPLSSAATSLGNEALGAATPAPIAFSPVCDHTHVVFHALISPRPELCQSPPPPRTARARGDQNFVLFVLILL